MPQAPRTLLSDSDLVSGWFPTTVDLNLAGFSFPLL